MSVRCVPARPASGDNLGPRLRVRALLPQGHVVRARLSAVWPYQAAAGALGDVPRLHSVRSRVGCWPDSRAGFKDPFRHWLLSGTVPPGVLCLWSAMSWRLSAQWRLDSSSAPLFASFGSSAPVFAWRLRVFECLSGSCSLPAPLSWSQSEPPEWLPCSSFVFSCCTSLCHFLFWPPLYFISAHALSGSIEVPLSGLCPLPCRVHGFAGLLPVLPVFPPHGCP